MKAITNNKQAPAGVLNLFNADTQWQFTNEERERINMHAVERVSIYSENLSTKEKSMPEKSKFFIRNMVSMHCIMIVKAVLESLDLKCTQLELGKVEINGKLSETKHKQFKAALLKLGFELLEDRTGILIERIKNIIIKMIRYDDDLPKIKFSDYLSNQLNLNYTYLSNVFSKVKGVTIEHFILAHKIALVKELLVYNELTLSEIAWKLHYSSVAHLSNQFKKMTGLTPTCFKSMNNKRLDALENL